MKPLPSSSTASFMLIATDSVTSCAWATVATASKTETSTTTRARQRMNVLRPE